MARDDTEGRLLHALRNAVGAAAIAVEVTRLRTGDPVVVADYAARAAESLDRVGRLLEIARDLTVRPAAATPLAGLLAPRLELLRIEDHEVDLAVVTPLALGHPAVERLLWVDAVLAAAVAAAPALCLTLDTAGVRFDGPTSEPSPALNYQMAAARLRLVPRPGHWLLQGFAPLEPAPTTPPAAADGAPPRP